MTYFVASADRALIAQLATAHKALTERNAGRLVTILVGTYAGRRAKITAVQADLDGARWVFICRVFKKNSSDYLAVNPVVLGSDEIHGDKA